MNKYTIETLKEINRSYDHEHILLQKDVEKANKWVELIESNRTVEQPQIGDIIEFTDKQGNYYKNAHIEKIENGFLYICESPSIPFVGIIENENNRFYTSTSGGAWTNIPIDEIKLKEQREKPFKDWGRCGACGNGVIEFKAIVNVWEYKEIRSSQEVHFEAYFTDKRVKDLLEELKQTKPKDMLEALKIFRNTFRYDRCFTFSPMFEDDDKHIFIKLFDRYEIYCYCPNWTITDKAIIE